MTRRVTAAMAIIVFLVFTAACATALTAGDGTYSVCEYPLPANVTDIGAMTVDAGGNVWLIQDSPPVLYKLVRQNLTFSNYTIDGFAGAQFTGLSVDELGIAWFTDLASDGFGAYDERDNQTADFPFHSWSDMAPSSIIRRGDTIWIGCNAEVGEYDLRTPDEPLLDHFVYNWDSYLYDIHFDRIGNVWFVEFGKGKVGVYWRNYDKTSEFVIPTENAYPTCLSIDNMSRMWFVESGPNKLGMFDTERFNFTEYDLPLVDGEKPIISRVATVGDTVWLTDVKNGRVIRFLPDEGQWAAAGLGKGTSPVFIEPDANGTLWIYESGSKKLVSLDVTDQFGQATPTPEPTAQPSPIATPQPTKAPGFLSLLAIVALASVLYMMAAKK